MDIEQVWGNVVAMLADEISAVSFNSWIKPVFTDFNHRKEH